MDRQVVMITGCAGGMGQAIVTRFVSGGWLVIGVDHNRDRLSGVSERYAGQGHLFEAVELASGDLGQQVAVLIERIGRLDALVNLAGISCGDALEELCIEDWDLSMAVNAKAPLVITKAAAQYLIASRGSIVNVGSPVGIVGARKPSYAASKAALHGLTMSFARNLGRKGVRANLLLPGTCITFLTCDWSDEKRKQIAEDNFLGRLCTPEEIASVVWFLTGKDASFVTGSVIDMTAGGLWGH